MAELELISALKLHPPAGGGDGQALRELRSRPAGAPVEPGTRHGGEKEASTVLCVWTVPGRKP